VLLCNKTEIETFVNTLTDGNFRNLIKLKGKNGKKYNVQENFPNPEAAAQVLSELDSTMINFINQLRAKYPNHEGVQRLQRYDSNNVIEGHPIFNEGSTSYSVNKGDKVVFCLRSKRNKQLHNLNLLIFVGIHELAHIMSITYGHNQEFMTNFKFLLKEALGMGVWKKINFGLNPQEYCGMPVTNSPV
jgi:hypothetical protein